MNNVQNQNMMALKADPAAPEQAEGKYKDLSSKKKKRQKVKQGPFIVQEKTSQLKAIAVDKN